MVALYTIAIFFLFLLVVVVASGLVETDSEQTFIWVLVGVILLVTVTFCWCMIKDQKGYQKKLRIYLDDMNNNVYNARGLHWSVGDGTGNYLQIAMNLNQ